MDTFKTVLLVFVNAQTDEYITEFSAAEGSSLPVPRRGETVRLGTYADGRGKSQTFTAVSIEYTFDHTEDRTYRFRAEDIGVKVALEPSGVAE